MPGIKIWTGVKGQYGHLGMQKDEQMESISFAVLMARRFYAWI
jgi:hypothetical protein